MPRQAGAATIFPTDHRDAAHADAAEQDEQLRLLLCVLSSVPARDQRRWPHTGSSHPNRRRDPVRVQRIIYYLFISVVLTRGRTGCGRKSRQTSSCRKLRS
jgi:hypothetical protein